MRILYILLTCVIAVPAYAQKNSASASNSGKSIFPLRVIQRGARLHGILNGAVSPIYGQATLGFPPQPTWGFYMLTEMELLDNRTPNQPYTKGKIGEQLAMVQAYGPQFEGHLYDYGHPDAAVENMETVVPEGHGGSFVDENGYGFGEDVHVPDDPDAPWFTLDQAFCVLDCRNPTYRPSAAVRKFYTVQYIADKPYKGLALEEKHRLGFHRGYYTRSINGVQQP